MKILFLISYGLILVYIIYLYISGKKFRSFLYSLFYLLIGYEILYQNIPKLVFIILSILLLLLIVKINYKIDKRSKDEYRRKN